MSLLPKIISPLLPLLGAGCVTVTQSPPPPSTGDVVQDGIALAQRAPQKDKVLWQYRTASAAMHRARFAEAKPLLDEAIQTIEGIFGPDASARRARSYFGKESQKMFIGEPYERAMAFYYRGILYWMDGEPDNARACFRSAQLHDSDADDKTYAADYVLLDYLDGLASVKLSADGSTAFQRAQSHTAQGTLAPYDPAANVLFFIEYGKGPTKYAAGQHREMLRFRKGNSAVQSARVTVSEQSAALKPLDDLYYQATTRGNRVIDHILAGQAQFRETTSSIGDAALITGAVLATKQNRRSSADEIGAGLLLFGLASKLISGATNPTADTRGWDNLPQYLSFAALKVPPGQHTATVDFLDSSGQSRKKKSVSFTINESSKDTVIFLSDK